jgi:hypothetical protein
MARGVAGVRTVTPVFMKNEQKYYQVVKVIDIYSGEEYRPAILMSA